MKTTLYIIRQGAADERWGADPPLGRLGVRQAELTRDFLAVRPIDHCYASPTRRAVETAAIIAAPHGLKPISLDIMEATAPKQVHALWQDLFGRHEGLGFLVVVEATLQRLFLADLLGLTPDQAPQVNLDPCGISVVTRAADKTTVNTLNASFHLQGMAA